MRPAQIDAIARLVTAPGGAYSHGKPMGISVVVAIEAIDREFVRREAVATPHTWEIEARLRARLRGRRHDGAC